MKKIDLRRRKKKFLSIIRIKNGTSFQKKKNPKKHKKLMPLYTKIAKERKSGFERKKRNKILSRTAFTLF